MSVRCIRACRMRLARRCSMCGTSPGGAGLARVSFTLHRGEILGIAGLMGAGRTELCGLLWPRSRRRRRETERRLDRALLAADWNRRGVGMLSEDRKTEGLAQSLSSLANITLPALGAHSSWARESRGAARANRARSGGCLAIKWAGPDQPVSSLSGGNQQKVALARCLTRGRRAPARRAHPRHRRRGEGRSLPRDRPTRRRGKGRGDDQLLPSRALRHLRPHRRHVARRVVPGTGCKCDMTPEK